jgi:hypothetical protein
MRRLGVKGFENTGGTFEELDDDAHKLVVIGYPKSFDI